MNAGDISQQIIPGTLPDKKRYKAILADPPWKYDFQKSKSRRVENHYTTMELKEILDLLVPSIAADDCILFLWATAPKLREALEVIKAWGFEYKTHAIWDKQKIGMGYYFRGRHELLLISTKGHPPLPAPEHRPPSILRKKRTEHSKKPNDYYDIIEKMTPGPRVELFARERREGWDAWGNQVPTHCQKLLISEAIK